MSIRKIPVEEFLPLMTSMPVLDVRSPAEYMHAHIPGALNLPLFSNEERAAVGTAYKQQSREKAIKIGLDYFGVKMRAMVEEAERVAPSNEGKKPALLIHCWRGGMRSAGVAWLMDLYGFDVYTLSGGYKAYRQWVLAQFQQNYSFKVIGGYTGSGKTAILKKLEERKELTIDLEAIAVHRGSAFGKVPGTEQPGQEMFENLLATALHKTSATAGDIWIEDESQRIGQVNLPGSLWVCMRQAPVYFLDIPFEKRLENIVADYVYLSTEVLINAIVRIKKRLGGLETKTAINFLVENNIKEAFRVLLHYYDKQYSKALKGRDEEKSIFYNILCNDVDAQENMNKLQHVKTT